MGAAWIQTSGPQPGSYFKTGVENWPSASRPEAMAIATALLTVPENKRVEIHTDSQNCIDTYSKLSTNSPKQTYKRWLKTNNWSVWSIIINTTKGKKLDLTLIKVKAHSNDTFNDKADQLAKEAASMSIIEWSPSEVYKIQTTPIWNGITIDIAPRNFIKEINKIIILKEWTTQHRINNLFSSQIQDHNNYGWKQFWNNLKKNNNKTSFKDNHKRSFLIKLIHNELPTLDRLAIRRPDLYNDFKKCTICLEENESREHLFQCKGLVDLLEQTWKEVMEEFKKEIKTLFNKKSQDKENHSLPIPSSNNSQNRQQLQDKTVEKIVKLLEQSVFKSQSSLLNFTLGLLDNNYTKKIISALDGHRTTATKIRGLLIQTSNKFRNLFRKNIWNYRCKIMVETDHTRGITLRQKKRKKTSKETPKKTPKKKEKEVYKKGKEKATAESKPIKSIEKEIYDWIKYG
jgi:ribonuclease HI